MIKNTRTRNLYDSSLVLLCSMGKEELIPKDLFRQIPASTLHDWRNRNYNEQYIGAEVNSIMQEMTEFYTAFHAHKRLKKTVWILQKAWVAVSKVVMAVVQKKEELEELLVNRIQLLFTVFPKAFVFKLLHISPSCFYEKLSRVKQKCGLSPINRCFKRHPLQLTTDEAEKIKKLFNDEKLKSWPASSLYYEGLRNRGLYIAKGTFYKYVRLLGLNRKFIKRKNKTRGIQTVFPNQFFHVDTTFWELQTHENQKAAIAFVSDNFSKTILGWNVSLNNTAGNVKIALNKAIGTISSEYPDLNCARLVADGGSENHAVTVSELLKETEHPEITKIIARKDIKYSNSPVEAVIKIVKRYLRIEKPTTFDGIKKCLTSAVEDYNKKRPHCSLNGLTPYEAYTNPDLKLNFQPLKQKAKTARIEQNKELNCTVCE